jgi:hypothetical protein
MKRYWQLWFNSLFMNQATFDEMSGERYAFAHGLTFIVIIGALVGISRVVGAAIRYGFAPPVDQIKNTVLLHLESMPWYIQMADSEAFTRQFASGYDLWWRLFGDRVVPNPFAPLTLASPLTVPVALGLVWLVYGVLVHLFARLVGGQGNLGHGLGTLALATSPQLLNILSFFPGLTLGTGLVGLWSLALNYVAVKTNYRLSVGRAVVVVILPLALLVLASLIFAWIGIALLARMGGRP